MPLVNLNLPSASLMDKYRMTKVNITALKVRNGMTPVLIKNQSKEREKFQLNPTVRNLVIISKALEILF